MANDTQLSPPAPTDQVTHLPHESLPAFRAVRFFDLPLLAAPGAFVPRAETELLARVALELAGATARIRVIDMCCGVGNLAIVAASRLADAQVWASDVMAPAANSARRNIEALGLEGRVTVVHGDLFAPLTGRGLEGTIDLIVCNPPYLSTARLRQRPELLADEPREAFDAGPFGLTIHQRVVRAACAFLRPGGWLALEFGVGQSHQIKKLFERTRGYGETRLYADAADVARVGAAQAKGVFAGV